MAIHKGWWVLVATAVITFLAFYSSIYKDTLKPDEPIYLTSADEVKSPSENTPINNDSKPDVNADYDYYHDNNDEDETSPSEEEPRPIKNKQLPPPPTTIPATDAKPTAAKGTRRSKTSKTETTETKPTKATNKERPTKEAPIKEAPTKATPTKEATTKEAPTKEAPTKAKPTKEATTKETPTKEATAKEAPTKATPTPPKATKPSTTPQTEYCFSVDHLWTPFGGSLPLNEEEWKECCIYNGTCYPTCPCYQNAQEARECMAKDWQVSDRTILKCPNDCSGHGVCVNGECKCDGEEEIDISKDRVRYFGLDCSTKTAPGQLIPSFVIVGAQKGGTTALFRFLETHPQIMAARYKEKHFLDAHRNLGVQWYLEELLEFQQDRRAVQEQLVADGKKVIVGEATPMYSVLCDGARWLYSLFPKIKVIFILREPSDRLASNWLMKVRKEFKANKTLTMDQIQTPPVKHLIQSNLQLAKFCFNKTRDYLWRSPCCGTHQRDFVWSSGAAVTRGIYYPQIEQFMKYFSDDQILILDTKDMLSKPKEVLGQVLNFLGLEPFDFGAEPVAATSAQRLNADISNSDKATLKHFYEPLNERLYQLIGRKFDW